MHKMNYRPFALVQGYQTSLPSCKRRLKKKKKRKHTIDIIMVIRSHLVTI